jgi:hypothetical protein
VPFFWEKIEAAYAKNKQVLEVGNVLAHYYPIRHDVVDKYEQASGVINADIINYKPKVRYDLIVTISTLEHVGWDEEKKEPTKIPKAVAQLQKLLTKKGELWFSVPLGYNPHLDKLLKKNSLECDEEYLMKRVSAINDWIKSDRSIVGKVKYNAPYGNANGIYIGCVRQK